MSVFSVPVTIGVDEEKIAESIQTNVETMVAKEISEQVKTVMFGKSGYYYNQDEPLRGIIKGQVDKFLEEKQDKIIEVAGKMLAEKLIRSKTVKEAAVDIVKEVGGK